jgi:hypothetical protein
VPLTATMNALADVSEAGVNFSPVQIYWKNAASLRFWLRAFFCALFIAALASLVWQPAGMPLFLTLWPLFVLSGFTRAGGELGEPVEEVGELPLRRLGHCALRVLEDLGRVLVRQTDP